MGFPEDLKHRQPLSSSAREQAARINVVITEELVCWACQVRLSAIKDCLEDLKNSDGEDVFIGGKVVVSTSRTGLYRVEM